MYRWILVEDEETQLWARAQGTEPIALGSAVDTALGNETCIRTSHDITAFANDIAMSGRIL